MTKTERSVKEHLTPPTSQFKAEIARLKARIATLERTIKELT